MKKILGTCMACACLAGLTGRSHAQDIAWGSLQAMTGSGDISLNGTYVDAADFYPSASRLTGDTGGVETDNGVAFNPITSTTKNDGFDIAISFPSGSGVVNYAQTNNKFSSDTAYQYAVAGRGLDYTSNSQTVTLSNLIPGDNYQVQVWAYDWNTAGADSDTGTAVTLTSANSVTLNTMHSVGDYVIGTFTATGATDTFTVGKAGTSYGAINAISLRDTGAIPEPGTLGSIAGGLAMLMIGGRMRRRS